MVSRKGEVFKFTIITRQLISPFNFECSLILDGFPWYEVSSWSSESGKVIIESGQWGVTKIWDNLQSLEGAPGTRPKITSNRGYQRFAEETVLWYAKNFFYSTGRNNKFFCSWLRVHPVREDRVQHFSLIEWQFACFPHFVALANTLLGVSEHSQPLLYKEVLYF